MPIAVNTPISYFLSRMEKICSTTRMEAPMTKIINKKYPAYWLKLCNGLRLSS